MQSLIAQAERFAELLSLSRFACLAQIVQMSVLM
jgi:hypothetical protein